MKKKKHAKKHAGRKSAKRSPMASKRAAKFDLGSFCNPNQMENFMFQGKNQFEKIANDASCVGRESMEAMNKSLSLAAKGAEEAAKAVMSLAQEQAEELSRLAKEGLSAKTINEYADVQNKIAQFSFDGCMAFATKMSEIGTRFLNESLEPINAQMSKAMKKATEAMAA